MFDTDEILPAKSKALVAAIEAKKLYPSTGRGGNDDDIWSSKPKGLAAKRAAAKSAPSKPAMAKNRPEKKGGVGSGSGGLNDDLPF